MMKPGDTIYLKMTVLRVEGNRVDAQTPSGQLVQVPIEGIETKPVDLPEHKAVLNAPENKNVSRRKNR